MHLTAKDIKEDPEFKHLKTLSYNDIVPFVFEYIKKYTFPVLLAIFLICCTVVWMAVARVSLAGDYPLYIILKYSVTGFIVIPFLLIIPHELLHIVPYYFSGARQIKIGAEWKSYYFYVTAHNHPVGYISFIIIAVTPFIVISSLLIILSSVTDPLWQWALSITLFVHTTMCAGDLALVNFLFIHRKSHPVTWDDADKKEAYIYIKT
ncbi:MAG: DUF3267 domain-containing protein [Bacteroidales bacterium]|nr:DUF3267 domain-containing protein [Bacteroidales bacterium]